MPHVLCYVLCTALLALTFAGTSPRLKLMSVAEIQPGMKGYGLSVFRGSEPERFDIEVIDVLHNFRPDQDLVLIKTPHPLLDHAGSVAGMSGSPIYIDGRLVGAYAYGWSFGKDPIAGVTPIATMLKELDRPLRPLLGAPLPLPAPQARQLTPHTPRDAFWALSRWSERHPAAQHGSLRPAATPLLVGGMTQAVANTLRERFEALGLEVLEAAGSGKTKAPAEAARYVDGGALAVTLIRGDVQATGVGTVTYVDGKRLVAFGHPMLDAGEARIPTATARVLHVLASERSSFKIAEAVAPLGALVHDRQSTIVVDNGVAAQTIPMRVRLRGVPNLPRDLWNVEIASHRLLTSSLVLSAISSALGAAVNDMADLAYRADTTVTLRKYGPQRVVEDGFSPVGLAQPASLSRLRLFDLIDLSFANPFELVEIERIEVDLDLRFGRDVIELVGARLAESEIDPGVPARVVL
ncbi:MAG TPA: SpoIVB peptidase S55 domain-containing protein, partial [Polyangiales bacterium]